MVVPALKVTFSPSGGGPKAELTAAVNVTVWPITEGLAEERTFVVVAIFLITSVKVFEMLPRKLVSPEYVAVIRSDPTANVEMLKLALLALTVAVFKSLVPCLNVIVPVDAPPKAPVTVAVNVTLWPMTAGFSEEVSATLVVALVTD